MLNSSANNPVISIVSPCFNEVENIRPLCDRVSAAAREVVGDLFEIILVNDGSADGTWQEIKKQSKTRPYLRGINLSRNYGHQLALTAGLSEAHGDTILMIDADLQDPPELLKEMMTALDNGADVAYGRRQIRSGETFFKKTTAHIFYRMINLLSDTDIPHDTGDFRLVSRRVLDDFLAMPERHRFVRGMISWVGYEQVAVSYNRDPRHAGKTNYTLTKMIKFATDAVTGFSTAPLRIAAIMSMLAFVISALAIGYVIYSMIAFQTSPGWASVLTAVCFFSGAQLLATAIIGEYLGRLYMESKNRPLYLISERTNEAAQKPMQNSRWRTLRDQMLEQPHLKKSVTN